MVCQRLPGFSLVSDPVEIFGSIGLHHLLVPDFSSYAPGGLTREEARSLSGSSVSLDLLPLTLFPGLEQRACWQQPDRLRAELSTRVRIAQTFPSLSPTLVFNARDPRRWPTSAAL